MKNKIFEHYLNNTSDSGKLYNFSYRPNWVDAVRKVRGDERDATIIEELITQNSNSDCSAVKQNMMRLAKGNATVIITGQQLGLFISPLYTIYKALTTIKRANSLNRQYPEQNFVPVFWLEGEDHDFAEINHFQILNKEGVVKRYTLPAGEQERAPAWRRTVPQEIGEIFAQLEQDIQTTEFTSSLLDKLQKIYTPGDAWLGAFKKQMQWLLEDLGMLFFNPTTKKIKQLSMPFIENIIDRNDLFLQEARHQSEYLEKDGYKNQVRLQKEYSYIFITDPERGRQPLFRREDKFYLKSNGQSWSGDELKTFFKEEPMRFSSTVLMRPIWQSWLLPVVSYVAGPAEIAYWAQIKSVFAVFELTMPHLSPRNSLTLIDGRIKRFMKKYDVDPSSIDTDQNTFMRKSVLNQQQFASLTTNFDGMKRHFHDYQEKISAELNEIDPTLQGPLNKTVIGASNMLEKFEKRVIHRIEENNDTMEKQLRQIHTALWPQGNPQERVISAIYFLNKYGLEWIHTIFDAIDPEHPQNQYLEI